MTQTGSRQFAAFIMKYCEWYAAEGSLGCTCCKTLSTDYLPNDWKLIGQGSYRWAFVGPDGVVYKVDKKAPEMGCGNADEKSNFDRINSQGRLPEPVYIPNHTLYDFGGGRAVMAMERVETEIQFSYHDEWSGDVCDCDTLNCANLFRDTLSRHKGCWNVFTEAVSSRSGLIDIHEDNIFPQSDGRVALIDAGM